jgi:hypothetical protein
MAKSITSDVIKLKDVRLSFADLFVAKAFSPGLKPTYRASFILDPSNTAHAATIAEIKAAMQKLAGEAFPGEKLGADRVCLKNGNTKSYDGWKDMIILTASNTNRPVVVNGKRDPVAEGDRGAPYSGCYVNATVTLWTQNNSFGKRINCNLRAVQFVRDGQAFGVAPVDAEAEFEALGDTADTGAGADFDI